MRTVFLSLAVTLPSLSVILIRSKSTSLAVLVFRFIEYRPLICRFISLSFTEIMYSARTAPFHRVFDAVIVELRFNARYLFAESGS